uniref:Histone deacetylase complex subunit SAP130 C-terminal domain-containing protein n=1 Tax=Clastoptera arizonana TaxID=38151 RepID=A0A1B6CU18_9HEMI
MGENSEQILERISMDLAASTPVIKSDQPRSTPAAALLRTVPLTNQQRFLPSNIQTVNTVISTSNAQNQSITKQGNVQRLESVPSVVSSTNTGLHQPAVINRLTNLPVHSNTTSSYHVPRGAAAVANIAIPRSPVATPIIRGNSSLQTIGVASSNNTGFVGGLRGTTPVARTAIQVASGTSWLGVGQTPVTTHPARQPTPILTHTSANTAYQGRASMTVTTRLGPGSAPLRINETSTRPVLLQAATTHKQISIAQPGTQVHIADKTFLKTSVVPVRPPTATLSYSNTNAAQSRLTVSNVPTQPNLSRLTSTPTLQPVVTSQPGLSRLTGTTTLPSVVSLHPAVIVPSQPSMPLKAVSPQSIGPPKILAQPTHGPAIQIQSVPVSSVSQPTIAITSVVTRPVGFPTTSTVHQTNLALRTAVTTSNQPQSGITKVFTQTTTTEPSVYIQAHKTNQGAVTGNVVSITNNLYTLPTTGFSYESSSFQVTGVRTFSTTPVTTTTASQTYSAPRPPSVNQVHGIVTSGQQIKYNPLMVVDHGRSNVHPYISSDGPTLVQTVENSNSTSNVQQQNPPAMKQNASPRPSILRKRDSEGTPLKAQKNLTPLLTSLSVTTPSSPPSPPKRPESRGNGGNQSSGGSTTISATSSPGLGAADPESPPIKQEPGIEEERIAGPPVEMSPRKKPRKQQLTGNQIQEPKFSDDDMEFISEGKMKKEIRSVAEDGNHIVSKVITRRPIMSLLSSYRHTWKSRHHHFLRYSDVKVKDDRRPSIHDMANQKFIQHKLNGWKIYHLTTQMEDLSDLESEVFDRLTIMLKALEKKPGKEIDKEVNRVNELIKGNIQRSKVITDQLEEAKSQIMKIFDHKAHVTEIISRCTNKRSTKKRDRL